MSQIVPLVSIQKDTVSDLKIEDFDEITQKIETMAKEILEKDEAWKEEKRQLELKRNEEAAEHQKNIDELIEKQREMLMQTMEEREHSIHSHSIPQYKHTDKRAATTLRA